ncbi:MAG: hypothetical protein ACLQPD_24700, partial [Desulfomonilaceae bacterium]
NSLEAPPLEEGELRPEASLKPMFHSNSLTTATKKPLALHCCPVRHVLVFLGGSAIKIAREEYPYNIKRIIVYHVGHRFVNNRKQLIPSPRVP